MSPKGTPRPAVPGPVTSRGHSGAGMGQGREGTMRPQPRPPSAPAWPGLALPSSPCFPAALAINQSHSCGAGQLPRRCPHPPGGDTFASSPAPFTLAPRELRPRGQRWHRGDRGGTARAGDGGEPGGGPCPGLGAPPDSPRGFGDRARDNVRAQRGAGGTRSLRAPPRQPRGQGRVENTTCFKTAFN